MAIQSSVTHYPSKYNGRQANIKTGVLVNEADSTKILQRI